MNLYLDTSALLKRYIHEAGSDEVMKKCAKADRILLSGLGAVELISAFQRLKRERRMSEQVYSLLKMDFSADAEEALVAEPGQEILRGAVACVEKTGIKASDAVHISTALRLDCDLFLTADAQQGKAARAMGLRSEVVPNDD